MKAIRIGATGGPEVMACEDVALPPPAAGEVRVRHAAIGVNFIDTYHRSGLYKIPLPAILGTEAAGVVEALGSGVGGFSVGDRVGYFSAPGAYAEANNVAADSLVRLPDNVSDEVAAASMIKGITAQVLLRQTYAVQPGQTILIHAAAGGVGLIAGQWAAHLGATVIGTVGSAGKKELALRNGCRHVLLLTDDWVRQVRDITHGNGVSVVYDGIGRSTFDGSLDCLAVRGLMVSFGNASGPPPAVLPATLSSKGSLYLTRPTVFHYLPTQAERQRAADELFAAISAKAINVSIHQRFRLAEARAAHAALESRATTGSTILIP